MLRRQLPVYSPLPFRAVSAAAGAWLNGNGTAAEQAEHLLHERYGTRSVLLTDSGTSALSLAIAGTAQGHGGPVALPAYCCYDMATAADGAGVPVVLYDIDPTTLGPDHGSLCRALDRGVSAVVVAHLYGIPVDVEAVERLAAPAGAVVIEDAAQGSGATMRGRPVGSGGSLAVVSFGRGKGMTAGRGALLAHDSTGRQILEDGRASLAPVRFRLASLVPMAAQWFLGRPALYGIPSSLPFLGLGETVYREAHAPAGLASPSCAVLLRTLPLAEREVATRRAHAGRLVQWLEREGVLPPVRVPSESRPGFLRFPLVVPSELRPFADLAAAGQLGIMAGYPRALVDLEGFGERCVNAEDDFAGARTLAAQLVTLPTHSRVSARDLQRLCDWLRQAGRASGGRERRPAP